MKNVIISLKLAGLTLLVCCVAYPLAVLALAQVINKEQAEGSLVRNDAGEVVGSRLIAQAFTSPRYFWPRPSAVDFDGQGAGGSNLAPGNPELTKRATEIIARLDPGGGSLVPADLVTASGSGLDPHISKAAAALQVRRIARARGLDEAAVRELVERLAAPAGGCLAPEPLVNVLEINLALDKLSPKQ